MPRTENLEFINISSVQDFQNDRLRWCYKWVENRVPRFTPSALKVGKLVHRAFENHFNGGGSVADELLALLPKPGTLMTDYEQKEVDLTRALVEPLEHWTDKYPIERTLEVEQPFVGRYLTSGARLIGRPDRVVVAYNKVWHMQHKTVGAGTNIGNYLTLAARSLHELLYGEELADKYGDQTYTNPETGERTVVPGLEYGGTIYDIVRKLKFRSKQVTKAEPTGKLLHTPDEIFLQTAFALDPEQQQIAIDEINWLSVEMDRTLDRYKQGLIVASNRSFDQNNYGKQIDPYTLVMMGEVTLDDDTQFMDREETYETEELHAGE